MDTDSAKVTEECSIHVVDHKNISKDWILFSTPVPVLLILSLYGIILMVGPRWMEKRPPFKLKILMRIYNIFQVFQNLYVAYSFVENPSALPATILASCGLVKIQDKTFEILSDAYLYYSWNYLLSKIIDLLDTVFMVLRKKNSHITFLHVYHHGAMVFFTWLTVSYTKSQHAILPALINVIVHTIMYTYYFLATFNRFKPYLWWKRHLTRLQLGQFIVILLYICFLYYYGCPMSRVFTFTWMFNVFVILVLFINFYIQAYIVKRGENKLNEEKSREKIS